LELWGKDEVVTVSLNIDTVKRCRVKLTSQILDRIAAFVEENEIDSAQSGRYWYRRHNLRMFE
jgi:hypothetical protein